MRNVARYIFLIITALILLQLNGVDVSSFLAGLGIVGIVVGLALQDWLKDIIRGISILSDSYFSVGDVVKYNGIEGKVLVIGLKTTKIQDLFTNNVISIANRNIEEIEVVSELVYVRIPMPHDVNVKNAELLIHDIIFNVKRNNNVTDCIYKGTTELETSFINYLIEVHCNPQYKLQVRRDTLRTILLGMEEYGIKVPYNQIELHNSTNQNIK
ncbi:MAG: mechanosensitive ion channel family protein [Clostridia bacterium]|nr:mechanosensitive ion channel family protein [Clostridia bacterium]